MKIRNIVNINNIFELSIAGMIVGILGLVIEYIIYFNYAFDSFIALAIIMTFFTSIAVGVFLAMYKMFGRVLSYIESFVAGK